MALHKVAIAAKDGNTTPTAIPGGIQQHDTSGTGAGPNQPMIVNVDSAGNEIQGLTTDAASILTDTTAVSAHSVRKQISASIQVLAGAISSAKMAVKAAAADFADGAITTLGLKADAANVATDTTSITIMSVLKQISKSIQQAATVLGTTALTRGAGATDANTIRTTLATDSAGIVTTPIPGVGFQITATDTTTRPADTNVYAANDVWSNSTSAPTAGGGTLTNAGRASGGSGILSDLMITSTAVPGTLLIGEIHLFDSAPTAVNDNAAWNLSDADALLRIAVIPFTLLADANNSFAHLQNLNIGYTCVGTANLRYLIKVKNAYTPASAEALTLRAKLIQTN